MKRFRVGSLLAMALLAVLFFAVGTQAAEEGANAAAWRHVAMPVSSALDRRRRWASIATSSIGSMRALATDGSREK